MSQVGTRRRHRKKKGSRYRYDHTAFGAIAFWRWHLPFTLTALALRALSVSLQGCVPLWDTSPSIVLWRSVTNLLEERQLKCSCIGQPLHGAENPDEFQLVREPQRPGAVHGAECGGENVEVALVLSFFTRHDTSLLPWLFSEQIYQVASTRLEWNIV